MLGDKREDSQNSYIHIYIYTDNSQKEILLQFISFNHSVFNFSKSFTLVDWARLCIPVIVNSMLRDSEKKNDRGSFTFIYRHIIFYCTFITLKWSIVEIRLGLYSLTLTIGCLGQHNHQWQQWALILWLGSFVHYRFAGAISFFGIIINLQHFGSNIFLFQVVFGILTILVRCLALYPLNKVGRRPTQMLFMFLVGLSILINIFVPQGERRLEFGERKRLFQTTTDCTGSHYLEPEVKNGLT